MMTRHRKLCSLGIVLVAALAAAACGGDSGEPSVTILSPAPDSSVPVGEPLAVHVSASDPAGPGVIQIDLQIDGASVDTFDAGVPRDSLTAELSYVPSAEGVLTVSAVAYREDGTASTPAMLALTVTSGEAEVAEATEEVAETSPVSQTEVRARAEEQVNVHQQPGVDCPVIGQVPQNAEIKLLIRTTSPTEHWYQTDYLGAGNLGWVYNDSLTVLADDSLLPRQPEESCASVPAAVCGDGTCGEGEDEETCPADCPLTSVLPNCGDGTCSPLETCLTCPGDCGACGPVCGDGTCNFDIGEDCETCPEDCPVCVYIPIFPECGDGTCNTDFGEDCETCPEDCPVCVYIPIFPECGDGTCNFDFGENCETCSEDCPICVSFPED